MGVSLGLMIDRIRIAGIGLTKEQYHLALMQLPEIASLSNGILKSGKVKYSRKSYVHAVNYGNGPLQSIARLEIGSTKSQHCYLAWELWPHRLRGSDFRGFHDLVQLLLPSPVYSYPFAYEFGRVSKLELAYDTLSIAMHSFIPWVDRVQTSDIYTQPGYQGTIYLGAEKSNARFAIYDKAKKLSDTKQTAPFSRQTRIESKLRKLKIAPSELHLIPNPFTRLQVADAIDCKQLTKSPDWQEFVCQAQTVGAQQAFSGLSKSTRKQFKNNLIQCKSSWWQPESAFQGLASALHKITPSFAYSS